MPKYTLQKVNGEVRDKKKLLLWTVDSLHKLRDGCIEVVIQRTRKDKSKQQLGAIFGLAISMIKAEFDDRGWDTSYLLKIDDPTGNEITTELLKEYLYVTCGVYDEKGLVRLSRSDTKQAAQFFDAIRNFASSQWGIVIPDPNPNWRVVQ